MRFGKEPLTATLSAARQAGASPRRVPISQQDFRNPNAEDGVLSLCCAGTTHWPDTLAWETRAPDPVTPPSPPNRPWRGRKVLESLRGRQALSAPYLGVLDLEVGRGRRQEVQGRHEGGGVGLHLAGHLDLTGSHEGGPRSRSPAAWFVRDVRSVREPGARSPVYRQVSSWGSSYWT